MPTVTISTDNLDRMLADVEALVQEVAHAADQDDLAKRRLDDIKQDPTIGKSEEELDAYLKQRGVSIE